MLRRALFAFILVGTGLGASNLRAQPANDDCASNIPLSDGVNTVDLTGATTDGGLVCDFGFGDNVIHFDAWFCYTATCTGSVTIDTGGTGFDTRLAAYNGCTCPNDPANLINCDEDGLNFPPGESSLTFPVTAGNTYLIQVGVFDKAEPVGPAVLNVSCEGAAPNDACVDALPLADGTTSFNNGAATTDGIDFSGTDCEAVFSAGDTQIHNDLWYCYTATCTGTVQIDTGPGDTRLAVYDDCGCPDDPLRILACDDDAGPDFASRVIFLGIAGNTYLVRVGSFEPGEAGPGEIDVVCSSGIPNDECANAAIIGDGVTAFANTGASTDGPDLSGFCDFGTSGDNTAHNDIWYSYTASCDGTVRVQTEGFDTRVAVYSSMDCPPDPSTAITCDDDAGPDTGSRAVFPAVSGETYLIQIGGFSVTDLGSGTVDVSCNPPVLNDVCGGAITIGDGVTDFDLSLAVTDGVDLIGFCDLGDFGDDVVHQDLWFCYTATCTGTTTVSTMGSDLDTRLAVYDGCACPADPVNVITCDDDGLGFPPGESEVSFPVIAGNSYMIQAGAFSDATALGPGQLTVSCDGCSVVGDLTCVFECQNGSVNLSWTNPFDFDLIDISENGVVIAAGLDGTTTSFVVDSPNIGDNTYTVTANCAGGTSSDATCRVAVAVPSENLILALEGLQTGGDLGQIDSGAALADALAANGEDVALLREASFDQFPCLDDFTDAAARVWVLTGTYPSDYRITAEEGNRLGELGAIGKGIYFEGGDHWGFGHVDSLLDTRDGIEPDINGNILDGDDTLNELDGLNAPGAGLDLSGFTDQGYSQDRILNDFNDQLSLTGTTMGADPDTEIDTAEVLWQNSANAPGEVPFIAGVIAVHVDSGVMISSTWEFGGFGGDQANLAQAYLSVLSPGGGGTNALRGDADGDGQFNGLVDGLFILNAGFVPGSPQPPCLDGADADGNGQFNALVDGLYILNAGFVPGSPLPPAPFPDCDEIVVILGCDSNACP